ncbi:MAG: ABC transporter ATP-binding protein [Bauldia sp.]|nr:ABC transporter ATP-binding protein [Bauldia sp.]
MTALDRSEIKPEDFHREASEPARPRHGLMSLLDVPRATVDGLTQPALVVSGISHRFRGLQALDDVSFATARGEITCLVGQSGCGKSTLLRVIAGIERPEAGDVFIGGRPVTASDTFVEPEHRGVGFMFQDYALFPHLTGRANIAFGLRQLERRERRRRVDEIVDRMGIADLVDRYPHTLSGGEQQRVALARALAPQPEVLLMDEPFSNLDPVLRDAIRADTLDLLRSLGITAIMVTHDPEEALSSGDRVVLMRAGRIVQKGRSQEIYDAPASAYAAGFFSRFNRIPARRDAGELISVFGRFAVPEGAPAGAEMLLFVRPQSIRLTSEGVGARVAGLAFMGEQEELRLEVAGLSRPVVLRARGRSGVSIGDAVKVAVAADGHLAFALDDTGLS